MIIHLLDENYEVLGNKPPTKMEYDKNVIIVSANINLRLFYQFTNGFGLMYQIFFIIICIIFI